MEARKVIAEEISTKGNAHQIRSTPKQSTGWIRGSLSSIAGNNSENNDKEKNSAQEELQELEKQDEKIAKSLIELESFTEESILTKENQDLLSNLLFDDNLAISESS